MSAFLLTMVVGRTLGSRLVRLVTSAFLLVLATTVALGGFLLFWLVPWAPVALVGLCVTGLGVANLYPLSMATALTTAPDNSGAASARVSVSSGIALFIAPLTVGGIADRVGLRIAYGIVPALLSIALIGIVLSLVAQRQPSLAAAASE
jgi:fucose permease